MPILNWKKIYLTISLIIGIALFFIIIESFGGLKKSFFAVSEAGWISMLIFAALFSLTLIGPAISWYMLMRSEKMPVKLLTVLKANFMGFPINFITPSLFLGSEPLKVYYISHVHKIPKRKILATIIVSKFQELGAVLLTMVIALGIALWKLNINERQETLLVISMVIIGSIFLLALYTFAGHLKPIAKIVYLISKLGIAKKKLSKLESRIDDMEKMIHYTFTKNKMSLFKSQLVMFISPAGVFIRPLIFFIMIKQPTLSIAALSAIYLVTNIINILPLTPGGLGFLEGGMLGIFTLIGLKETQANTFSILIRTSDIILIALGIWLIIHLGLKAVAKRTVKLNGKKKK